MKEAFSSAHLSGDCVFLTCSSHEDRCLGIVQKWANWRPERSVVFHYDDLNPRRERNHTALHEALRTAGEVLEIPFTEGDAVKSFRSQREKLERVISESAGRSVVVDVSVFTKRHLLMLLRWLDDYDCWNRLWVLYTEPEEYEIEGHLPLSFGVSCIEQVPGFSAAPDPSRPLHVAMFLGYEGDRAFATYEVLQARQTTLIIPDPPFRPSWAGRTEILNRDLLAVVGESALQKADSLDPDSSFAVLTKVFGDPTQRSECSRAICPLGTKPQVFGAYLYLRQTIDPPAVIYTGSLRHNHSYYSRGVGPSWLIHHPS
jgi:hypothetical protein